MISIPKLASICFCVVTLHAQAELLLDYTPPGNDAVPLFAHSSSGPATYASSFTVDQQSLELTSMFFRLDGLGNSYDFNAYLFSDATDQPGAAIATVHRAFPAGELVGQGLAFYEFTLTSPVTLSPETKYWVGIGTTTYAGSPSYIAYTSHLERFTSSSLTPSLTHCTAVGYPLNGTWGVNASDITVVYELQGSVIPEPTATALCLLGVCLKCIRRPNRLQSSRSVG